MYAVHISVYVFSVYIINLNKYYVHILEKMQICMNANRLYIYVCVCVYIHIQIIDIKKVDKQLNVVYGTIRYERCSRNPLSGPLLFIYNNMYLSYIY